jgi:DNA-binding HxlR family transcriptional regulator
MSNEVDQAVAAPPEGYILPPARRRSFTPGEPEQDPRFAQFSELCAAFTRMVEEGRGVRDDVSHRAEVSRNLAMARSVFGKWGVEILIVLYGQPEGMGFEALRRALEGISPRVLSLKVKALESQGLVQRDVLALRPPRVAYSLTLQGRILARMSSPMFIYLEEIVSRSGVERTDTAQDCSIPR